MTITAYIGLGANLNDPASQIEQALLELDRLPDTRLAARSALYASAPVGCVDQPDFVNAVAQLHTTLAPRVLLTALLDIEQQHGRARSFRNAPRTLDLDLLLYGSAHFYEDDLTLPHPRITQRAFVLLPLTEVAPDLIIPGRGRAADWLAACADQHVTPLHLPKHAIAGL